MEAIHALRCSTYTVEVNGSIVKVEAFDRAGAELAALIGYGGSPRVIDGPLDPGGCCEGSETACHFPTILPEMVTVKRPGAPGTPAPAE